MSLTTYLGSLSGLGHRASSSVAEEKPQIESDAAIQKTFQVWESWSGTIRLQSTNVLNHENLPYSTFDTNPNDGTLFGTVLPGTAATSNAPPRNVNIQVQIRF